MIDTDKRARWELSPGYPNGWCVTVRLCGRVIISRYYAANGGEWELEGSVLGHQLVGTSDIRIPRKANVALAWSRRHLAHAVRDARADLPAEI
jgi:hypothetical protein